MNWLKKLLREILTRPKPLPVPIPVPPAPDSDVAKALLDEHNKIRASYGKKPLVLHQQAVIEAQIHADNMARSNNLTHMGFMDRAKKAGLNNAGENVAWNQSTVEMVLDDWMNSSGHRANILKVDYKYFGGGRAQAKDGSYYWCAIFGT